MANVEGIKYLIDRSADLQRGGHLREALAVALDALRAASLELGERHPVTAEATSNLAAAWEANGDPANAIALATRAVAIFRALGGPVTPEYVSALFHLGVIHAHIGDYYTAVGRLRCVLVYQRREAALRALPQRDAVLATTAHSLAGAYSGAALKTQYRHFYARATRLYRWALAAYRRAGGEHGLEIAAVLNDSALLDFETNPTADVLGRLREARDIRLAAGGPQHPDVAHSFDALGRVLFQLGDLRAAEENWRQSLAIKRAAPNVMHRSMGQTLLQLAYVYSATAQHTEALDAIREAASIDEAWITRIFHAGSEAQLVDAVRTVRDSSWGYVGVARRHGGPAALSWAGELLIRRHALSRYGALLTRRALVRETRLGLKPKADELGQVEAELMRLELESDGVTLSDEEKMPRVALQGARERLQQEIAVTLAHGGFSLDLGSIDAESIRRSLPPDAALVQFVEVTQHGFVGRPHGAGEFLTSSEYVAAVITPDRPHCALVGLGDAAVIDQAIAAYRAGLGVKTAADSLQNEALSSPGNPGEMFQPSARDAITAVARAVGRPEGDEHREDVAAGQTLGSAVFGPLVPYLDGRTRLIVIPDGNLTRLPIAVLPLGPGRRVIDQYEISNLASARDLVSVQPVGKPGPPLVIGDPDFDLTDGSAARLPGYPLMALTGTHKEAVEISGLLAVEPVLKGAALTSRVKQVRSPAVLHIATHACSWDFGLAGQQVHHLDPSDTLNPLLRSGLMLAGANTWLTGGGTASAAGYGLLFAQEVIAMDLRDTELVVLSACETGLGHVFSGEGMFGLGRAFAIAGAKTVVMSSWRVPDKATGELMVEFYRGLLDGHGRSRALRQAQLSVRRKYENPFHWGAFVCEGEAGPLVSREPSE